MKSTRKIQVILHRRGFEVYDRSSQKTR